MLLALLRQSGSSILLASSLLLSTTSNAVPPSPPDGFAHVAEQFADLRILRYRVPDFDKLSLKQKTLVYYLSQAALAGRDIIWDQNFRYNLTIRHLLEEVLTHYKGERTSKEFAQFMLYCKRVWFSNGIHHHYGHDKIMPEFTPSYLSKLVAASKNAKWPLRKGQNLEQLLTELKPVIFDPTVAAKKVVLDPGVDMITSSAVNFYRNVTQEEASNFYRALAGGNDPTPPSYGLNSRLIKNAKGTLEEQVYKVKGLYGPAIAKIVAWLEKAKTVAETDKQAKSLGLLSDYYRTGDLRTFDAYNIAWVDDTEAAVDAINGWIEVYNDPLGYKGSWESVVSVRDFDATAKYSVLSKEAAWFEANSPIDPKHKREKVTGVTYKVINVVAESGDSSPSTPVGINLPNANWIRIKHGSKSVSLGNIEHAYEEATKSSGALQEFYLNTPEQPYQRLIKEHGTLASKLTTGLHEVVGHGSGQLEPGVGQPAETLKNYASALEEARADLVALYYIGDDHMRELGLIPGPEVMQAEYASYLTNGLMTQLARIDLGKQVEEAHMRNRQMISAWVFERGKAENVVEMVTKKHNGQDKTYIVVNDFQKLRTFFGELLKEVQRIKSQGDFAAGKALIETYGVKIDPAIHQQVKQRWAALNLAPFSGFLNPELVAVTKGGKIIDVQISYPNDFTKQMLKYGKEHANLPTWNE
jgi:dipeptidyl-peptidase-3